MPVFGYLPVWFPTQFLDSGIPLSAFALALRGRVEISYASAPVAADLVHFRSLRRSATLPAETVCSVARAQGPYPNQAKSTRFHPLFHR